MVGKNWIRIGDYDNPGFDDLTMSLAFLPDLKTEFTTPPACLQHKAICQSDRRQII